jgi:hypothetical protein
VVRWRWSAIFSSLLVCSHFSSPLGSGPADQRAKIAVCPPLVMEPEAFLACCVCLGGFLPLLRVLLRQDSSGLSLAKLLLKNVPAIFV